MRRYFLRHPAMMDAVVVAWFAVPVLSNLAGTHDGQRSLRLTLTVAGAGVLIWRRHSPVWIAGTIGLLAVLSLVTTGRLDSLDLGAGLAIYAVTVSRPARTAWVTLITLCLVVNGAVFLWIRPGDGSTQISTVTFAVALVVIYALGAIAIGTNVRSRRMHVSTLVERANRLAVERDQQVQLAAAAERARIAREMHDVVAHSLSVMIALADGAGIAFERSPVRAREAVAELSATGRSALADVRRVLGILREPGVPFGPAPGVRDLAALVERFRTAGLPVRTTFAGAPLPADAGLQLAVYRIVQESLTNALRHAPGARRVDLVVAHADGAVGITVTDDGRAHTATWAHPPGARDGTAGKGLIGMRERAAVYGGVIETGPHRDGWRTRATLTWTEETS